jgi:K+-dependent Na+/Ca+ exchanger-like protein
VFTTATEANRAEKLEKEFLVLPTFTLEYRDEQNLARPQIKTDLPGWVLVYVLVILWMFAGIAIVCDEFFVPALEAFVDDFGISMDVAGATFMAAGGSMPELFTSFISTFQGAPEVGFAAILGSAVFNVLFVIAVCAIFNSTDALELTWYPLARDVTFYVIALVTVAIVFGVTSENEIHWLEALVLLAEYVCYCSFMKVNGQVEDWIKGKLKSFRARGETAEAAPVVVEAPAESPESAEGSMNMSMMGDDEERPSKDECAGSQSMPATALASAPMGSNELGNMGTLSAPNLNGSMQLKRFDSDPPALIREGRKGSRKPTSHSQVQAAKLNMPSKFRQGIVSLMSRNASLADTAGIAAVVQVKGSLEETFKKLDLNEDGMLNTEEVLTLLTKMGVSENSAAVDTALRRLTHDQPIISFEVFKRWYLSSEARAELEVRKVFDTFDEDGSQTIDRRELRVLMKELKHTNCTEADLDELITHICNSSASEEGASPSPPETEPAVLNGKTVPSDQVITYEQFEAWYTRSLFFRDKLSQQDREVNAAEDGEEGLSLDAPDDASFRNMVWYIITYPLVAALYCTLPDVRHEKHANSKYRTRVAIVEFLISLIWIGIFCTVLFECTVVVSNWMGIKPEDAGVTVLAAGTSIPDLISSYIVAKNGEGDMAVSSSIGSNIFDVTVGLPLPWIMYCAVHSVSVPVSSEKLFSSILVLIAMLMAVIITIVVNKWKLTKNLGYAMMALYFVFLAQHFLLDL